MRGGTSCGRRSPWAGIVLGVAVFVGDAHREPSVLAAFSQTIDRIAGKTDCRSPRATPGSPEEVLERVQGASTVAVAVPAIEAVVESGLPGQGNCWCSAST